MFSLKISGLSLGPHVDFAGQILFCTQPKPTLTYGHTEANNKQFQTIQEINLSELGTS